MSISSFNINFVINVYQIFLVYSNYFFWILDTFLVLGKYAIKSRTIVVILRQGTSSMINVFIQLTILADKGEALCYLHSKLYKLFLKQAKNLL
jgi:hypothetical protein